MKRILTVVLLAFVAFSAAYLVVNEVRSRPAAPGASATETAVGANPVTTGDDEPRARPELADERSAPAVIAYYFHATMRCPTCLKMEEYARKAIEETYPTELGEGRIRWQAVNYDEPANEHFVKEYELVASTIVVRRDDAGEKDAWRKLERIWDLVGDEGAFKRYVIEEVSTMLRDNS